MGMHQMVAILIFILAAVAVLPIPNLSYRWPLAVAIMLLAVLQFLEGRPSLPQ
jgi:hypothetical protein